MAEQPTSNQPPATVVQAFPDLCPMLGTPPIVWQRNQLPTSFSDAIVWCGQRDGRPLVGVKAHLESRISAASLRNIAQWRQLLAHTGLVPQAMPTRTQDCVAVYAGRLWEAWKWHPGVPMDLTHDRPLIPAALRAIQECHAVWRRAGERRHIAPIINGRLKSLEDLARRSFNLGSPWDDLFPVWRQLSTEWERYIRWAQNVLMPWTTRNVWVAPCLGDCWYGNFLTAGSAISGIVDWSAYRVDAAEVDIARFLGSCRLTSPGQVVSAMSVLTAGHYDPQLVWAIHVGNLAVGLGYWQNQIGLSVMREPAADRVRDLAGQLLEMIQAGLVL
jgi:Phosphotransferase enzyme family